MWTRFCLPGQSNTPCTYVSQVDFTEALVFCLVHVSPFECVRERDGVKEIKWSHSE